MRKACITFLFLVVSISNYSQGLNTRSYAMEIVSNFYDYKSDFIKSALSISDSTVIVAFPFKENSTILIKVDYLGNILKTKKIENFFVHELIAINDSGFIISGLKNYNPIISSFSSDLNFYWTKKEVISTNIFKLTNSKFIIYGSNHEAQVISKEGNEITAKKNLPKFVGCHNKNLVLCSTNFNHLIDSTAISFHLLDSNLIEGEVFETNLGGFNHIYNIISKSSIYGDELIGCYTSSYENNAGNNFFKLNFRNSQISFIKYNLPIYDEIISIQQLPDSSFVFFGQTLNLGKAWGSAPPSVLEHPDLMIGRINKSFKEIKVKGLGTMFDRYGYDQVVSGTANLIGKKILISYLHSFLDFGDFETTTLNFTKHKPDSLIPCDIISNVDSIYTFFTWEEQMVTGFTLIYPYFQTNSILSDTISFGQIPLLQDTLLCQSSCDIKIEIIYGVVGKGYVKIIPPDTLNYSIEWSDGYKGWSRFEGWFTDIFDISDTNGCTQRFYYHQSFGGVNAIEGQLLIPQSHFTLYPNPTNGVLNFSTTGTQKVNYIQIYDLFGRMVYELKNVELFEGYSIDLSHLQNGVYFVVSRTENKQFTNRIIISQ